MAGKSIDTVYEFPTPQQTARNLTSGSGGGDNGGMEARVAKLESAVEHIQSDILDVKIDLRDLRGQTRDDFKGLRSEMNDGFRGLRLEMLDGFKGSRKEFYMSIGFTFATTIGLAGLIAKGFGWL